MLLFRFFFLEKYYVKYFFINWKYNVIFLNKLRNIDRILLGMLR